MRALRGILLLILILGLIWIGLWWYAQSQLVISIHRAETKLRETGWTINHGPIISGHSPLAARVTVPNLVIMPPGAPGTRAIINFPQVSSQIRVTAPFTVALDLPRHFTVSVPGGSQIAIKADAFAIHYHFSPNAILQHKSDAVRGASTRIRDLQASVGGSNFPIFTIGAINSRATNHPHAESRDTALRFNETIKNIAVSPIFVTLAGLPFSGQIKQLTIKFTASGPDFPNLFDPATLPPATTNGANPLTQSAAEIDAFAAHLRPWASHGGHGHLDLVLRVGPLDAKLNTGFTFDSSLQPQGHGLLNATGLTAFFTAISTAQPRFTGVIAAATTATAPFMTTASNGHHMLHIALTLRHRNLALNGKPAITLPLINWPRASVAPVTH